MKQFLANIAQRLAPRTVANLRKLNHLDPKLERDLPRLISYERELRQLRREVDELRRDNRRVAELYDVFFQWAHHNAGTRATSEIDAAGTVKRVADVLSKDA
jgi:transposase